jgi:DDE superfamily endonuclease
MLTLPKDFRLLEHLAPAFTPATYQRLLVLLIGAILTGGRRTVSRILWKVRPLVQGHPSSYHRCLSHASIPLMLLGRLLAELILERLPPDAPVQLAVDDTTAEHRGAHVYGKGCHRDAVRSSHGHLERKWGHRWVVLSILVPLPGCSRPWALPVLCALYRPPKLNRQEHRRHQVPSALARSLVAVLLHAFPQRRWRLLGDGHFSGHDLADFAARHRDRLTVVGRLRADARLFEKPGHGRRLRCSTPRGVQQIAAPEQFIRGKACSWHPVPWYGGAIRRVGLLSSCGVWYRGGLQVYIRWVYVFDPSSGREDYFYATDPSLSPVQIVRLYAQRWNLEVTFQEVREHLGLESPRNWCRRSVLRSAPMLLGLYSLVTLLWAQACRATPATPRGTLCYHKTHLSFADALFTVRQMLWEQVLWEPLFHGAAQALGQPPSPPPEMLLLEYLAEAA